MMPARFSVFASLALVGTPMAAVPASAQDVAEGLSVMGSMRLRYEAIDGQARAGFNESDALVNLRTAILAEYRTRDVRLGVELYDSRVWADRTGTPVTTNEVNALEPVQVYVAGDIDGAFGKGTKLTLTAGRMTLNLGSRRLVAADDYRNTTNGYTGLRADIAAPGGVKATLIYTLPQVRLPDDAERLRDAKVKLDRENFGLVLWGGQLSRARTLGRAMVELTYFRLGERDAPARPTRDRSLDTFGGRIIAEPRTDAFDYEVETFYQTGSISASLAPTAARQAVSASFVHADLGYSFSGAWKPRLSVEFDRASGDKPGGKFGRFDTLYGMRRADLAPAGLYNAVARANIMTPGIRLEVAPSKRLDAFAVYRAMWLAADEDSFSTTGVRDASGRSGDFAGHQLEARVRYWLVPARLRFEFDGLLLAKGRFLRDAPNAPAGRWTRYGSFNLTASF
ncbi:alginate export family protein [Sphingomonas sp. DG1-23]|uniref:alginate export family protein n=1 Tax=Sphingomonas sp. DG1-23 TaxID=3068316 RepID=UPI00273DB6F8|nr:alginate export family protein [Sphingomonas sp. DG1-23]MDP5280081.1 alginate export family protein [Sphingomonas sp. DG1-23]